MVEPEHAVPSARQLKRLLRVYSKTLKRHPNSLDLRTKLAEVLRLLGRHDEAIALYSSVAWAYGVGGNLGQAITLCTIILELNPSHSQTQQMLAKLYASKQIREQKQSVPVQRVDGRWVADPQGSVADASGAGMPTAGPGADLGEPPPLPPAEYDEAPDRSPSAAPGSEAALPAGAQPPGVALPASTPVAPGAAGDAAGEELPTSCERPRNRQPPQEALDADKALETPPPEGQDPDSWLAVAPTKRATPEELEPRPPVVVTTDGGSMQIHRGEPSTEGAVEAPARATMRLSATDASRRAPLGTGPPAPGPLQPEPLVPGGTEPPRHDDPDIDPHAITQVGDEEDEEIRRSVLNGAAQQTGPQAAAPRRRPPAELYPQPRPSTRDHAIDEEPSHTEPTSVETPDKLRVPAPGAGDPAVPLQSPGAEPEKSTLRMPDNTRDELRQRVEQERAREQEPGKATVKLGEEAGDELRQRLEQERAREQELSKATVKLGEEAGDELRPRVEQERAREQAPGKATYRLSDEERDRLHDRLDAMASAHPAPDAPDDDLSTDVDSPPQVPPPQTPHEPDDSAAARLSKTEMMDRIAREGGMSTGPHRPSSPASPAAPAPRPRPQRRTAPGFLQVPSAEHGVDPLRFLRTTRRYATVEQAAEAHQEHTETQGIDPHLVSSVMRMDAHTAQQSGTTGDPDTSPDPPKGYAELQREVCDAGREQEDRISAAEEAEVERSLSDTLREFPEDPEELLKRTVRDPPNKVPFPLFSDLDTPAFLAMVAKLERTVVPGGKLVFQDGDPGDSLFLVSSGQLQVLKQDDRGRSIELAQLGAGSFFGEFALLTDRRRHASVRAIVDCELLELRREVLAELIDEHPSISWTLRLFYQQRLMAMVLATSPLFQAVSSDDRRTVLSRFTIKRILEGEVIIEEGKPGTGFYVILVGEVSVSRLDEHAMEVPLGTLSEGNYFGEISLLTGSFAEATVRANQVTEVLVLSARDFYDLTTTHPEIWAEVQEAAERRQRHTAQRMAGRSKVGLGPVPLV